LASRQWLSFLATTRGTRGLLPSLSPWPCGSGATKPQNLERGNPQRVVAEVSERCVAQADRLGRWFAAADGNGLRSANYMAPNHLALNTSNSSWHAPLVILGSQALTNNRKPAMVAGDAYIRE